jgi:hypothetical protein
MGDVAGRTQQDVEQDQDVEGFRARNRRLDRTDFERDRDGGLGGPPESAVRASSAVPCHLTVGTRRSPIPGMSVADWDRTDLRAEERVLTYVWRTVIGRRRGHGKPPTTERISSTLEDDVPPKQVGAAVEALVTDGVLCPLSGRVVGA